MSDTDHDPVSVTEGGITVEKVVDTTEFDVPSVIFHVESAADVAATVRIRQTIPESVDPSDIGFHPEYDGDKWQVTDVHVEFARDTPPGESFITLFGVQGADPETDQWLKAPPRLDITEPRQESPEWTEIFQGTPSDPESKPSTAPYELDANFGEPSDAPGSLVEQLAAELDQGAYSDEHRRILREHLRNHSGSTKAKIEYLQHQVSDFEAYIDHLEEFFDDNGTPDVVASIQDDLAKLDTRIVQANDDITANTDSISRLREDTESIEQTVLSIDETVGELQSNLATQHETIDDNATRVDEHRETLDSLESDVESLQAAVADTDSLATRLETLESTVNQLETRLQMVQTFHNRLTTTLEETA